MLCNTYVHRKNDIDTRLLHYQYASQIYKISGTYEFSMYDVITFFWLSDEKLEHFLHNIEGVIEVDQYISKLSIVSILTVLILVKRMCSSG